MDLFRTLSVQYFWDCSARVRCSGGAKVRRLIGGFSVKVDLAAFPVLASDRTFIAELDLPQPLTAPHVVVQLGMLFTTGAGERRARVLTFQIPVSPSPHTVVASADPVALAVVLARRAADPRLPREPGLDAALSLFAAHGGSQFPVLFRLAHAFLSGPLARAGLGALGNWLANCPVADLLLCLCPRMFALDRGLGPLPCVAESFALGAVFLFHACDAVYIWVGDGADPDWVGRAIGGGELERRETAENAALWETIDECRQISGRYLPVVVIRQGDPREAAIGKMLLDRADGAPPFADWYRRIVAATGGLAH
jgi:hypothetical protein